VESGRSIFWVFSVSGAFAPLPVFAPSSSPARFHQGAGKGVAGHVNILSAAPRPLCPPNRGNRIQTCPPITQINADTEKEHFICVHLFCGQKRLRLCALCVLSPPLCRPLPRKFSAFAYFPYFAVDSVSHDLSVFVLFVLSVVK
jgi:hypothetical protein